MMEMKETKRTVIAKPVACRPVFSKLKSFSTVLSGAVHASPYAAFSENPVTVEKPSTVRFNPICNSNLIGAEALCSAASHPSKEVPESKSVPNNVVYKPLAKLVSKSTIAFLANLGGQGITSTREITDIENPIQFSNQVEHQIDNTSNVHPDLSVEPEKMANSTLGNSENDGKSLPSNGTRPSYDGHNWRKYGQKQVKGSEYARSYYKCTYPTCPVKKKVEKTLDGRIVEIVYKGEHNHSKPRLVMYDDDATRNDVINNLPFTNQEADRGKCDEVGIENRDVIESSGQMNFSVAVSKNNDPLTVGASDSAVGMIRECDEVSETLEAEDGEFKSKRMKCEKPLVKEGNSTEGGSSEPRIIIQNNTDSEIIGDGFRWRKYGQKVVKGKIFPRSYYRCTSPKCTVRKYVEKMSEDPGNVITTYEGRHNHSMPIKSTKNAEMSKTRSKNKS